MRKSALMALGWIAAVALCAGPVVASANTTSTHYGFQYRDLSGDDFSNGNSNNGGNSQDNPPDNQNQDWVQVPEPGTLALTLCGLGGLLVIQRRRRSK